MGKRKKATTELKFWLSGRIDNKEQRFIQVGNSMLLSKKFQDLSAGARWTYQCMCMESGGRKSFEFPQAAAKKYGISPNSLLRHVKELEANQFIKVQSAKHMGAKNMYEFNLDWKLPKKETPTHGYI